MKPESSNREPAGAAQSLPPQGQPGHRRRWLFGAGGGILLYLAVAYVIMPLAWKRDVRLHAKLFDAPRITHTPSGIPGDPINLALLGTKEQVIRAMTAARWAPADPLTFDSSVRIAVDSVFRRPDTNAPVSTLELFGRKQDLAFEQPIGNSPRQRHHVRFWHWDQLHEGREVWFGAVTLDQRVGLSHTTGQVTHHIGPDLDAERDRLMAGLEQAGVTEKVFWVDGFQELQGRNGGGDPWHTDGRLEVAVLKAALAVTHPAAATRPSPTP
ncbi:MAG: LssY C-terminal domain-containing protein [Verrucomicrobia bacterium]|nr:LssY C-terminal domain-containing protein [Verrucomicrobiota bacterium]